MPKKTTTIVEEDIPSKNPTEDHDKGVLEALEGKEEALTIEPDKLDEKEEKPEEKEEKIEEKVEAPVEPVLDKEAIKAELKAEVTEEVKKELTDKLVGTEEEQKDAYSDFEKEVWDKEKRTPTYKEALDFVKGQAKDEIKAELNAEIEEETKQEAETKKAEEEQQAKNQQELNDSLNKTWDEQLDDLVKQGKIPPVKDPNDNRVQVVKDSEGKEIERIPLDVGKRARYDLFKAMYIASEERINNGGEALTNLKEIFYEHYGKKQPSGSDAPVAGARKGVSQDSGNSFNYSEVHNKSFEELLKEAR